MGKTVVWLEYCKACQRKHYISIQKCPSCGVYETPQPVSEKVYDGCMRNGISFMCDGCEAYKDHLR